MRKNTRRTNIWRCSIYFIFLCAFSLAAMVGWRFRAGMRESESFNSFFPTQRFLEKVHSPVPDWMQRQLAADFKNIRPISSQAVARAYETIESRIQDKAHFYHYRILDNKLYKYISEGQKTSSSDTVFEKAFKTLLSQIKVPDLDFILCPMDGIPEPYMPKDFYLMNDPEAQVPILAQSKLKEPLTRSIVLIPDQFSLSRDWYQTSQEIVTLNSEISWAEKLDKALWRGGLTDMGVPTGQTALLETGTPRLFLCRLSMERPSQVDAGLNWIDPPSLRLNLEKEGLHKDGASKKAHLQCKYLPVLDGHMCTYPGYQWRLLSNSLALKQESDEVQWFYSALEPYEHYLPIARDMSDLIQKIEWAKEHENDVRQMVEKARDFASNNLMFEDDYRYLYLVLNCYSAFQNIDFEKLKRETKQDPRWVCIQYRKRLAVLKMLRRICDFSGRTCKSAHSPQS